MCIAKLQMRKSRHIPGGSSFVTAEVKKKPARPKKTMNGKRACRHTSPYLFYIGERIYAVCVPFISFYMLIFFGEDLRLEIYEIVFPFIMLFDPPFVGFENQPRLREGRQQPAGRQDLSDNFNYMISTFSSFKKNDKKTLAIDGRHLTGLRLDKSWLVRSGGGTTSQKRNSIAW